MIGLVEKEENEARLKANRSALRQLLELEEKNSFPPPLLQRLRTEYEDHIEQLELFARDKAVTKNRLISEEYEKLQKLMLQVERQTILRLRNERVIGDTVLRRIQRDLDLRKPDWIVTNKHEQSYASKTTR